MFFFIETFPKAVYQVPISYYDLSWSWWLGGGSALGTGLSVTTVG